MKTLALTAAAVVAALAFAAPASANETNITLNVAMAPGVHEARTLDFKVDERQYAFERSCAPFEHVRVRYTGIKTHGLSCRQVRVLVKLRTPRAFVCSFFPLALSYVGQGAGVTTYSSGKARFYCNRSPEGTSFAFTARDLDR